MKGQQDIKKDACLCLRLGAVSNHDGRLLGSKVTLSKSSLPHHPACLSVPTMGRRMGPCLCSRTSQPPELLAKINPINYLVSEGGFATTAGNEPCSHSWMEGGGNCSEFKLGLGGMEVWWSLLE